jgi:hypothetical protein
MQPLVARKARGEKAENHHEGELEKAHEDGAPLHEQEHAEHKSASAPP